MDNQNLEKAKQLAKDAQARIKANIEAATAAEAEKETESKGAEKTEGSTPILENAEKQAETDARILSAKDEDLSDDDKKRKDELLKAKEEKEKKREKEETVEEKIKRTKEETQKRIDEVIGELKAERAEREQDKKRVAELEAELKSLKQPKAEEDKSEKVKQLVSQQISKHLEEDKNKPREDRREMSREDLEEWLIDDYVAATEWLTDRNIRRRAERDQIESSLDDTPKKMSDEFIAKQQESAKKLIAKYPKLADKNSPEYSMLMEIVASDSKKYVESVDAPELVMAEMDRRYAEKATHKVMSMTEEEFNNKVKEAADAEIQRRSNLDEGITSSGGKKRMEREQKSELRLKQEAIAKRAGISIETVDARIKDRERQGIHSHISSEEFAKD